MPTPTKGRGRECEAVVCQFPICAGRDLTIYFGIEPTRRDASQRAGQLRMKEFSPEKSAPAPLQALPEHPMDGDFFGLLRASGAVQALAGGPIAASTEKHVVTEGTTILAIKFRDGVLVAGDRRATAGNLVVYDRADKVLTVDEFSLLAISGVPAVAWETARVLQHSLKYYRRSQLQEMSLEGKVRMLSKLLMEKLPMILQGIGAVAPIFAAYDTSDADGGGRIFFYDILGAQFEGVDYATSGSGAMAVRSVLYYLNTWGEKPLAKMSEDEAAVAALRLLDTAAESDTATGGYNRRANVFPLVSVITRKGIRNLPASELARLYKKDL